MPTLLKARQNVRRYSLAAGFSSSSFSDDGVMTELWLYNQQTPGPLLAAKRGEVLEVEFHNNLQEPTTIHWHGIRNLNEMDGVPGLTQQAIEPGDSFTYRFPSMTQVLFGTMHIIKLGSKLLGAYMVH